MFNAILEANYSSYVSVSFAYIARTTLWYFSFKIENKRCEYDTKKTQVGNLFVGVCPFVGDFDVV